MAVEVGSQPVTGVAGEQRVETEMAFDAAFQYALTHARESLELNELFRTLEQWRRLALLQRDPQRSGSVIRRAAERLTGEPVPEGEPLERTRRRAGL